MSTTQELVEDCELVALSHDGRHERRTAYVLRAAAARLSELERENARLREALKPFADYAKAYDEYSLAQFGLIELDTHVMGNVHRGNPGHPKDVVIIAGDLRRARAALAGSGEK
jgi:hypothetical protein